MGRPRSHEVVLAEVVVVVIGVGVVLSGAGDERGLRLLCLGLLTALLGGLLLAHLLVAEGGQGAGDLLDLVARQVLGQLLGELLQEQRVVRLPVVGADEGHDDAAQVLELRLRLRVEQWQRAQVYGLGRVLRVDGYRGARGGGLPHAGGADPGAADAEPRIAEQVLGVLQVGVLLGAAQALTALGLGLLVVVVALSELAGPLGLDLGDALSLGLLVGGGLGVGLGLGLCGLLGLLSLDLGILGGVPGF